MNSKQILFSTEVPYIKRETIRTLTFVYKSTLNIIPPKELLESHLNNLLKYRSLKTIIFKCKEIINELIDLPKFNELWNFNSEENIGKFIIHLYLIILSRKPDTGGFKTTYQHIEKKNIANRISAMIFARIFNINNEGQNDNNIIYTTRQAAITAYNASNFANRYVEFTNKYIKMYEKRYCAWKQTIVAAKHAMFYSCKANWIVFSLKYIKKIKHRFIQKILSKKTVQKAASVALQAAYVSKQKVNIMNWKFFYLFYKKKNEVQRRIIFKKLLMIKASQKAASVALKAAAFSKQKVNIMNWKLLSFFYKRKNEVQKRIIFKKLLIRKASQKAASVAINAAYFAKRNAFVVETKILSMLANKNAAQIAREACNFAFQIIINLNSKLIFINRTNIQHQCQKIKKAMKNINYLIYTKIEPKIQKIIISNRSAINATIQAGLFTKNLIINLNQNLKKIAFKRVTEQTNIIKYEVSKINYILKKTNLKTCAIVSNNAAQAAIRTVSDLNKWMLIWAKNRAYSQAVTLHKKINNINISIDNTFSEIKNISILKLKKIQKIIQTCSIVSFQASNNAMKSTYISKMWARCSSIRNERMRIIKEWNPVHSNNSYYGFRILYLMGECLRLYTQKLVNKSNLHLYPKVTALMLTRKRPLIMIKSLESFIRQTWPNKEIVIVYDYDDIETEAVLQKIQTILVNKINLKIVKNNRKKPSVGYLRNLSVNASTGKYCTQWDDDDIFDDDRIWTQMIELKKSKKKAVVIDTWWCMWADRNTVFRSPKWSYEGSILAERQILVENPYPDYTRIKDKNGNEVGEDTFVINNIKYLKELHMIHAPLIYFYRIHNTNTCSIKHFEAMEGCAYQMHDIKVKRAFKKTHGLYHGIINFDNNICKMFNSTLKEIEIFKN